MKTFLPLIAFTCFASSALHAVETSAKTLPSIEIESKFIELPVAMADALKLPANSSFMDKFPGKPLPTTPSYLRAVLNEKDAEQLLATLNAQKGVDLCSSPRVTTRSQQRAVVEVIREFRYATEWNAPDEKEKNWTPKEFDTRNVGLTLEVTPTLREDGLIDLKAEPSVVEFLGFVDFETNKPIFAAKADLTKTPVDRTTDFKSMPANKPPFRPYKPIFSTRKASVDLTITPGQTVVLDLLGESEKIEPFAPVRPGYRIIVLIRASSMQSTDKSVFKE